MIRVDCYRCGKELDRPGWILFGPMDEGATAVFGGKGMSHGHMKVHFCEQCGGALMDSIPERNDE